MSRILPILFNTDMVRAILEGRKTTTRRIVKFLPGQNPNWSGYERDGLVLYNGRNEPCSRKPPYKRGDILYVREAWNCLPIPEPLAGTSKTYWYRADGEEKGDKWKPSIHMPKEAARIWIKITDVKLERLKEITDEEAEKEGCCDYTSTVLGFFYIWDATVKKSEMHRYGWDANPWVWVIEFERCERPEEIL